MSRPEPPVFREPWQAQLFAVTVGLNEAGHFTWPEWAEVFGAALKASARAAAPDEERSYWEAWLAALEGLLDRRDLAPADETERLRAAWAEAYRTTPHGQPVRLPEKASPCA